MGQFKKGQSGNPNGRPKGTPNKVTGDIKQVLTDVLNGISAEQIIKDLNSLKPYERLKMIDSLASYVIPRAKEEVNTDTPTIKVVYTDDRTNVS